MTAPPPPLPPGWHPDPWSSSGERWWDGVQWSSETRGGPPLELVPPAMTVVAVLALGLVAFALAALAAPVMADEADSMGRDPSVRGGTWIVLGVVVALAVAVAALAISTLGRRFGRTGAALGALATLATTSALLPFLVAVGNEDRGLAVFVVTLAALVPGFGVWIYLIITEVGRDRTRFPVVLGGLVLVPLTVPFSFLGVFTDELVRTGGYQATSVALALVLPLVLAGFALLVARAGDAR